MFLRVCGGVTACERDLPIAPGHFDSRMTAAGSVSSETETGCGAGWTNAALQWEPFILRGVPEL